MKVSLALLALAATRSVDAEVLKLDDSNFATATFGKTVFVLFGSPRSGPTKAMAPDWEKLAAEWEGSDFALIAEVDCTSDEATETCHAAGVDGWPSMKYGDPDDLEEYDGGRDFEDVSHFAKLKLKPICSLKKVDLCSNEQKALIDSLQAKSIEDLQADVKVTEDKVAKIEKEFMDEVEILQAKYTELMKKKDAGEHKVKEVAGFSLIKAVLRSKEDGTIAEEL